MGPPRCRPLVARLPGCCAHRPARMARPRRETQLPDGRRGMVESRGEGAPFVQGGERSIRVAEQQAGGSEVVPCASASIVVAVEDPLLTMALRIVESLPLLDVDERSLEFSVRPQGSPQR